MNRRQRKLVRTDLQFKVVFSTLFVATFVLLVNFLLVVASLWTLSAKSGDTLRHPAVRTVVTSNFLFCLILAIPLAVTVGILYSFKFSGPIYRFKKYFTEITQGRWSQRCGLRKGDLLGDLADTINAGMDCIRVRLQSNHALLQEIGALLGSGAGSVDAGRVEKLKARISEETAAYARHMEASGEEGAEAPPVERREPAGTAS